MKHSKMLCTALLALTLTALTACGETISTAESAGTDATNATSVTSETTAAGTDTQPAAGQISYVFKTAAGIEIPIKAESDPIVAQLGTPTQTFEAPSCAFDGKSFTYTYPGLTLETYPDGAVNRVYAVTITDETQKTPEGLTIGATADEVRAACGTPEKEAAGFLRYSSDGIDVQFFKEDDVVNSIIYTFRIS